MSQTEPIYVVASDMDGTFLRDDKTFDEPRFRSILQRMHAKGCKFVVASGNQYIQLKQSFDGYADTISYVAENGSYVVDNGKTIYTAHIEPSVAQTVYTQLISNKKMFTLLCGLKATYIQKNQATDELISLISYYFPSLQVVNNLLDVDDVVLKFCAVMKPQDMLEIYQTLDETLPSDVQPMMSGYGSIDIVCAHVNKARGLDMLVKRWGYDARNCIAFGDAANDIEMLKYAQVGYAMANAMEGVAEIANKQAPSNNDDGVLEVLDTLF